MQNKPFISVEEADNLETKFQEVNISPKQFLALAGLQSINDGNFELFWGMDHTGTKQISTVKVINREKWLLAKIKYGV